MSGMTESATRTALLQMVRAPLSYGRRLLSAEAIHELTWRAFHDFITADCSVARCMRVEHLISGRRCQVLSLLATVGPVETAKAYTGILDALAQLQSNAQATTAAAAMDAVIKQELLTGPRRAN